MLDAVEKWTGDRPPTCPWRAFSDPFVRRVLEAFAWFDKGQLSTFEPDGSARLLYGLTYYQQAINTVRYQVLEEQRRNAAARAEAR